MGVGIRVGVDVTLRRGQSKDGWARRVHCLWPGWGVARWVPWGDRGGDHSCAHCRVGRVQGRFRYCSRFTANGRSSSSSSSPPGRGSSPIGCVRSQVRRGLGAPCGVARARTSSSRKALISQRCSSLSNPILCATSTATVSWYLAAL